MYFADMNRYFFSIAVLMLVIAGVFLGYQNQNYTQSLDAYKKENQKMMELYIQQIQNKSEEYPGWESGNPDTNAMAQLLLLDFKNFLDLEYIQSICILNPEESVFMDPSGHHENGELYGLEIFKPWIRTGEDSILISPPVQLESQYFIAAAFPLGKIHTGLIEVNAQTANMIIQLKKRFFITTVSGIILLIGTGLLMGFLFQSLIKTEQKAVENERLATVGQMTAGIAHEIKNPLGIIRSSAQLLADKMTNDTDRKTTRFVIEETDRLNRKIREFLMFAKNPQPVMAVENVSEITDTFLENVKPTLAEKSITLEKQISENCFIRADRDQLLQVFHNLLINTVESLPNGGNLTVCVKRNNKTIRVSFADDGPGIPPGEREKVFQPFFSGKRRGTGLGLALSKRMIEANMGKLYLEEPAKGCTITLALPEEENHG